MRIMAYKWISIGMENDEVEKTIEDLLSRASGRGLKIRVERDDRFLLLRVAELSISLLVSSARDSKRPLIAQRAEEALQAAGRYPGAIPVVVCPHMTPAGIETAEALEVAWFDLAGNCHLSAPGLLLWVQGRKPEGRRRGRPSSAFGPRSSRLARALLIEPKQSWTQKELTAFTRLPQPTVSRALSRLRELGLARQDEETGTYYRVTSPGDLLDAWSDDYDYLRQDVVPIHLTGAGIGLARKVVETLRDDGLDCALTGMPAAWLYDHFSQFRLGACYVAGNPLDAAERLGARVVDEGANFHLVRPQDRGVFDGREDVEDLPCVHPVQVYLDLMSMPERSAEAAGHLRQEWLHY
jgi:DNA-binding transcriptional ArsR family regulator